MNNKWSGVIRFCFAAVAFIVTSLRHAKMELWYDEPAEHWYQESLPIGNGYMGALIRGKVDIERIPLNEETTWAGGPGESEDYNFGNRPDAWKHLEPIRDLLRVGDKQDSYRITRNELFGTIGEMPKRKVSPSINQPPVRNPEDGNIMFPGYGNNQTTCDLLVDVLGEGEVSEYRRSLDLESGLSFVEYKQNGVHHKRTAFASYPDRVMVFRYENDRDNGMDYAVWMEAFHKVESTGFKDGVYSFNATLENNGMKFQALLRVEAPGAEMQFAQDRVLIIGARTVDLYVTIASDYLNDYPTYTGRDYEALNRKTFSALSDRNYYDVLARHMEDYHSLFGRVMLTLGKPMGKALPTDKRLKSYADGGNDPGLEALYFQYGRYLLISSSRPGTLPAHLQGKWNVQMDPQWACDYHTNINLQMSYWPAEVTNLSETHKALIDYTVSLQEPGRQSAKDFFNTRGWIVNTMNNIFGYTAVNWGNWGYAPASAGWLTRHLWEHYEYTQDKAFLERTAYPVMLDAALFWLDYLVEDENGKLVSMPSFSPEHGGISVGASMDHQIVWDLFTNLLRAGDILCKADPLLEEIRSARARLLSPMIGRHGQLQEWKEDRDDPDNQHRHVSHLYALHPGYQISVQKTPDLAAAARKSLEFRGDGGTGWSMAWKVNFWARLQEGERAYKLLRTLLKPCIYFNHDGMSLPGGTYSNLLCAHPPFQIDGNLGGTAGMAEMLLQSHAGVIHLLPAIPQAWETGSFRGLKARGGFELDANWEHGRINRVKVTSLAGNPVRILSPNRLTGDGIESVETQQGWESILDTTAGRNFVLTSASPLPGQQAPSTKKE